MKIGYGMAMVIFTDSANHVVFEAAVVAASLLGCIMKKPPAVPMLLCLCFPVKMVLWLF